MSGNRSYSPEPGLAARQHQELVKMLYQIDADFVQDANILLKNYGALKEQDMDNDNLQGGRSDDEVKFFIDSEPAYYAVMDRFGDHIDFRGDDMVAPLRLWGAIQQTAGDAGGAADIAGLEDDRMGTDDELDERGVAEGELDKFKKYTRPVTKTTPKIEKTTNPSGRTTDHVEWKVTTPTGEIHRYKSKKQAQEHFDSFGQQDMAEGHGNYAGDRPVNLGGVSMKKIQIGDTVRYIDQTAQVVDMSRDREHARITIPSSATTKTVLTSDLRPLGRGVSEETLSELSPATLARYKIKAGAAATAADSAGDRKTGDRRFSGIVKATKKQFNQDATQSAQAVHESRLRLMASIIKTK
jgi:hypothetical protein